MSSDLSLHTSIASNQQIVHRVPVSKVIDTSGGRTFSESFGSSKNPPVLLLMGSGCQGLIWPNAFCGKLANRGFFVIRFDQRDTGRTVYIEDKQQPYDIKDLAQDALAVLDGYGIQKAHCIGFSMGGIVAQFIEGIARERAMSLTLISTSTTVKPFFNAFAKIFNDKDLSPPKERYITWLLEKPSDETSEEKINNFMQRWRLLNGEETPFDEDFYLKLAEENFKYAKGNSFPSHSTAMRNSYKDHANAALNIKCPTLIIQPSADPLFGVDHGKSLQKAISHSKFIEIEGMGHAITPKYYDTLITAFTDHLNPL